MSLTDLLWLATAAYGVHILEEYQLNWRDWARAVIGLPVEWSDFYVVNALVIVLGIVAANLAGHCPGRGARLPGIDADQRHVLPRAADAVEPRPFLAGPVHGDCAVLSDRRRLLLARLARWRARHRALWSARLFSARC